MAKNTRNYQRIVHKNIVRDEVNRSVTEQGAKALRSALEDAKLRLEHRQEVTGGKRHE
ncbi:MULTISPECIES: hypothetical protein [Providencia]|uniref:hypothetical protein n=1 Tax=Providencia TaxID=586 RepID=UPI0018C6B5C3|nr:MULTISPECIES: hypothetical protein [Providencia]ELR5210114.1 hypothetical protein [Providencia rettgeri]MBG5892557.1 hypothetical protein [Providencia rettgeri]CAG9416127.1 hypothetical protein NVI2019_GHJFPKLH_01347 [Providencia alcalifaciens]